MNDLPGPRPTRAEADARLERLWGDVRRVESALTDIEDDPGYLFLSGGTLAGRTQIRWTSARAALERLWSDVADLRAVLDVAETIRHRHSQPKPADLAELADLLSGPSVRRTGLDPGGISVTDLIATMTVSLAEVVDLCGQAQAVLSEHANAVDAATTELAEVTAAALGLTGHPLLARLAAVDSELDQVRELVFTDPLALTEPSAGRPDTARIDATTADLAAARRELDALAEFHANGERALDRVAAELADLTDAEAQAHAALRLVGAEISTTGLPEPPDAATSLAERLAGLRATVAGPQWWQGVSGRADLSAAIAAGRRAAAQVSELVTALLDRRAELRGRLEAYQAKANRLGFAGDTRLSATEQLAKSLLWATPCELGPATRALAAYQRLITERESTR